MSIITEKKKLWGTLHTRWGKYEMLEEFPQLVGIPFSLRSDGLMAFSVMDRDGYGLTIFAKLPDGYLIERPVKDVYRDVKYVVEDSPVVVPVQKEGDTES
jgi:hypothetical protein